MRADRWLAGALALAAGGAMLLVWGWHAAGYFFLFDDYALLAQATRTPVGEIASTPLFGFYRPFVFLATRLEGAVFGWGQPAGHAAANVLLHALNAALVALLARRLLASTGAAAAAGLLFLASPWSAEAVFWMSGRFDLWAAFGVLAALAVAVHAAGGDPRRRLSMGAAVPLVAIATAAALFSKESSVVLALLLPLTVAAAGGPVDRRRLAILCGVVAGLTVAYLAVRSRAVSLLGGVYGDWGALMRGAPVTGNLGSFARAVLQPPVAHDASWRTTGLAALTTLPAAAMLVTLLAAAGRRTRQAGLLAAALGTALLPVLWIGLSSMSSAGGRAIYLPGAFVVLWAALGVSVLANARATRARAALLAGCALLAAHHLVSLRAQAYGWRQAAKLARAGIEQFEPLVGRPGRVHVTDLPFWFEEGPYVLKSYAFGLYYHPRPVPEVSASAVTLTLVDGRVQPVTRGPEPGAPPPAVDGTPVTLAVVTP
jgi:hypothetical protein